MGSISGRVWLSRAIALGLALTGCGNVGSGGDATGGVPASGGSPPSEGGASTGGAASTSGGTPTGGSAVGTGGGTSTGGSAVGTGGGTSTGGAASTSGGSSIGGSSAGGTAPQVMTLEEARANYKATFTQRTSAPEAISAQIFSLCRLPTLPEKTFSESEHGKGLYLLDWLNAGAGDGYAQKTPTFAVGSVIVKEKLTAANGGFALAALGIMIKHGAGFDSAHGDWEFGYWEQDAGMLSGQDEANYCGACHAGSNTDFVFLDQSWRTP